MARRGITLRSRARQSRNIWRRGRFFRAFRRKIWTTAQVVRRSWVRRYQEMGVAGLEDRAREARPVPGVPRNADSRRGPAIEKSRLERENTFEDGAGLC